jgi:hypothetical protein
VIYDVLFDNNNTSDSMLDQEWLAPAQFYASGEVDNELLDLITPLKQVLMQVYVTGSQVEDP